MTWVQIPSGTRIFSEFDVSLQIPNLILIGRHFLIIHMCTALADIHTNIPAVPQNDEVTDNHTSVRVTMKDHTVRACRGGIDINHLLGFLCVELPKYFSTSFLTFLPDDYKRFNFSNVEESFENLRYKYISQNQYQLADNYIGFKV